LESIDLARRRVRPLEKGARRREKESDFLVFSFSFLPAPFSGIQKT
jgi:hypothetical protein